MSVRLSFLRGILLASLALVFGPGALLADTLPEIQERMRERVSEIDTLKRDQLVGENNQGLLEKRAPLTSDQEQLKREENEDRERIYAIVAEQSGATPEQVGQVRARQIAQRSSRGVLIQNDQGEWVER